jgi:hypothetical protein
VGVAPILQAAGTGMEVAGILQQGLAEEKASEYNAKNAENNAKLAREQGYEEERRQRIQSRKQLGDMRASYGASGVTMEGSAMDVLGESAAMAELDAQTIRQAGEAKAAAFESDARYERFKGHQAKTASRFAATTTILKGASKMGGSGAAAAPGGAGAGVA